MVTRNMVGRRLMAEPEDMGTDFGSSGLFSSSTPSQPKIALFGDSISSAVGYGQDSQPDTKYGGSVADVLSKKLGTPVENLSMGGVTTKDALTGSAIPFGGQNLDIPYGNFQQYLQTEKPNVVLLRFGAADAIRLNDPKQTLANIQQMVTMAKEAGATPILVGVSPFAKGGDSRAGNINAGSIDPYIGAAEEINKGIQQIANQNGLNFVDMQKLEVPKGALLDGVHPTADFGNKMAEYIGNAVTAALPQFGGSPEKFQAFSQSAPSKAVAAANSVSSTPTAERILSEGGGNPVNIDGTIYQPVFDSTGQGETFEQGPLKEIVSYKAGETATGQSYKTYTPDMQEAGTGQFKDVGNIGDLLKTAGQDLAPLAAMALTMGGAGGALGGLLSGGSLTGTAASALGNALISGGAGALTGQDPLKSALLAAGGTFAGGLFGGAEAASAPTLSDAQFIAADAAQLASQGLGVDQIEQVLRASGVNTVTAIAAADAATSGMNVDQIAQDITLGNRGLFSDTMAQPSAPTTVSTSPEGLQTVTTTGAAAPAQQIPGLGLDWFADQPMTKVGTALEESAPFVNNVNAPDINAPQVQASQPTAQQIDVTGTAQQPGAPNLGLNWYADQPLTKLGTALEESAPFVNNLGIPELTAPAIPSASDVQQIAVTGAAQPSGFNVNDILATLNPTLFGPDVTNQVVSNMGTQPPVAANQVIDVTGTQQQPTVNDNLAAVLPSLVTGIPTVAPPSVSPTDQVIEVTQNKQQQPNTTEDLTAAIASLVNPPVVPSANQVIDVTGTKQQQPTTTEDLTAAIASLVNPPVVPSAPITTPTDQVIEITQNKQQRPNTAEDLGAAIAASVNAPVVNTPANQVIDVTGTAQPQKNIGDVAAAINAGSLYGPGMTGTQTTVYDKTLEATGSKPIADAAATAAGGLTLADLLKALTTASSLGMLGGGGGGGVGTRTSMVPSTPVPMGNSDYYNAVQRYYNAYMPAAPRDVATPLQQWYEGKFGG